MATNSNVYCSKAIMECGLDGKYTSCLGCIIDKDSPGKTFSISPRMLDMECIDMDYVEKDKYGDNDKTMDLLVGLSDFDDKNQKVTRLYLLPVELKLNCINFNLKLTDLKNKDSHTRDFHLGSYSMESVFLFTNSVVGQARSTINRWKHGTGSSTIKNWIVMNPDQFNSFVKFKDDFPYHPQTNFKSLANIIDGFVYANDIEALSTYLDKDVKNLMYKYVTLEYNLNEARYIAESLEQKMNEIYCKLKGDNLEYIKLLVDPILNMARF